MKRHLFCLVMLLLTGLLTMAQEKLVTGKVTDQQDQPASFASIRVKGSKRGATADAEGNFSIKASLGASLIITGTNLNAKEIQVADWNPLSIQVTRKDANLTEVVVSALGVKRNKNNLSNATQQISGADLNKTPTTNFVSNLSGKIAGLQITTSNALGGSNNVILRGMRSLTQNNQALFVVDGVPYDNTNQSQSSYDLGNSVADINPNDIESVSVLKGAAAALYGSRGSNGVILITTKKGIKNKALGIVADFGMTVGTPDKSTLPTYQTQYGEGYGSSGLSVNNDPNQPGGGFFYFVPTFNSRGQNVPVVLTNDDAAIGPAYDPSLQVYNWDAFAPGDPNYGKSSPWKTAAHFKPTDFFVTPVTTTSSMFVTGSGDRSTFKMGYTHNDTKDYFPNSSLKKNILDLSATYDIVDNLTLGGSLSYSDVRAIGRYLYAYTAGTNPMTDFRQWWPTNVDILQQKADYFNTRTNNTWNWPFPAYLKNIPPNIQRPSYHDNLYWDRYENNESDSRGRYFGNINLNYKITSYLNLLGRISMDNYNQLIETKNNVGSQSPSFYSRYNSSFNETNYDLLLSFDKNVSNDWNVKALLGTNVRQTNISSISASTLGGLIIPGFYALSNSKNTPAAPVETFLRKEVDGVFGQASLSYRQMITVDATLRRDQSSTLPKNNNSYYYPSVSGNFVFSKLLGDLTWLSYGKVWGNYAIVGGDAPYYSLKNTYLSTAPFNGQPVSGAPFVNNNPNLVPEKNKSFEVGLEAAFLHNRLGFTAVYYKSNQTNQITPVDVSNSTGYNTFFVNGGSVQNQGVELTLNITPIRTKDFSWDVIVNWSKNINKVISLYNNQPSYIIGQFQNSINLVAETGKAYGIIQGSDYSYDKATGQRLIDDNGHYILSNNPLSDIGNMNPDWLGGINNSFRYKSVALSFLIDMRQGGQLYSLDMDYGSSSGLYPRTAGINDLGNPVRSPLTNDNKSGGIVLKGINPTSGKPNTMRIDESDVNAGAYSFSSAYGEADREFVYDASYIKLREMALTWSLPAKMFSKGFLKGIDIALTGRNLWIIHKNLPYADPEQGQASSLASGTNLGVNGSQGFQNGAYPTIRSFGANFKFKF